MGLMKAVELGFGSEEACQAVIGIPCTRCRYFGICAGEPEPKVEKYLIGLCMGCGNDFEVDIREDDNPVLMECCPNCGCEVEWNIWEA